ncbi:sulfur carrier protein ThiS [Bacillus sp. DTU_2020_1000418_1_SI_GHA_SEK_038]|uniref:sulfur carrier protein ThiS n=1 Tax=Bacillus sp. DTU_2020_1000418_1_SI_GHA_SEK_038 TaxID=3077585 RepID=UPI0028EDB7CD|nr:sulfur carrier protein ThiS [Bacillus sp. DTU_2020_1000418_1_SI_GHA_SEK_038]WNS76442.1 sulfur carrier protein ThiS [Bacillus sp. DTU_2020_1000418_1_SI_GHA_SEK_038]
MSITLNGQAYTLPEDVSTVQQLLQHLELSKRIVIVEVNKEIVQKDQYNRPIRERDQVEMIHFVGGG